MGRISDKSKLYNDLNNKGITLTEILMDYKNTGPEEKLPHKYSKYNINDKEKLNRCIQEIFDVSLDHLLKEEKSIGKSSGRKRINIPVEEMVKLKESGMSDEKIAKYFTEKGIEVSYVTINNRLNKYYSEQGTEKPYKRGQKPKRKKPVVTTDVGNFGKSRVPKNRPPVKKENGLSIEKASKLVNKKDGGETR